MFDMEWKIIENIREKLRVKIYIFYLLAYSGIKSC